MKTEQEIFDSLATLCKSPGYVQALAFLCLRDNPVRFHDQLTGPDLSNTYSSERLLRTEQSVLIGLLVKNQAIDTTMPSQEQLEKYLESTDDLLEKLHFAIIEPTTELLRQHIDSPSDSNPLASGAVLREAIFYAGEAAFTSQYVDLAVKRYRRDNAWLKGNKGFKIEDLRAAFEAIGPIINDQERRELMEPDPTPLSVITVRADEVSRRSDLSEKP